MPRVEKIRELCARVAVSRGHDLYAAMVALEDAIDSYLVSLPEYSTHAGCPQCGKPIPIAQTKCLDARFIPAYHCRHCESALVN